MATTSTAWSSSPPTLSLSPTSWYIFSIVIKFGYRGIRAIWTWNWDDLLEMKHMKVLENIKVLKQEKDAIESDKKVMSVSIKSLKKANQEQALNFEKEASKLASSKQLRKYQF